jgi:hypothetical protein
VSATPVGIPLPTALRAQHVPLVFIPPQVEIVKVRACACLWLVRYPKFGAVCQLGCTQCADGSGTCITCQSGFTQDANDHTKCISTKATTSSGSTCPDGSFSNGTSCSPCSSSCTTCSGPTSNDCIICASGTYKLNSTCVSVDGNGVCANSKLIADNNKHECDSE